MRRPWTLAIDRGFAWFGSISSGLRTTASAGGPPYRLPEVLLLFVCGTIGACDDFDEIVEWGEDNLPFPCRFLPYHHGVPGSRWLRALPRG